MLLIELIACLVMTAGTLILLRLPPFELAHNAVQLIQRLRKPTLKQKILAVQKPKKLRGIRKIIQESRQVLKATNQTDRFYSLSVISLVLICIGLVVAMSLNNVYLIPVLAVGFGLLPFLFVLYKSAQYKKELNEELESALSTITTSYLRCENFMTSVRENMDYLNSPVRDVFLRFVNRVDNIDPDVVGALEEMKAEIDHSVFQEWVDAVILCQDDRNQISTLVRIVAKFSKIRTVTGDIELTTYKPTRNYLIMLGLLYGIILLICVGSADWSKYLLIETAGKLILAVVVLATLWSLVRMILIAAKPVDYKR